MIDQQPSLSKTRNASRISSSISLSWISLKSSLKYFFLFIFILLGHQPNKFIKTNWAIPILWNCQNGIKFYLKKKGVNIKTNFSLQLQITFILLTLLFIPVGLVYYKIPIISPFFYFDTVLFLIIIFSHYFLIYFTYKLLQCQ